MSARPIPEPIDTLTRIVDLIRRAGLDRDDVLRVEGEGGLAFASGLAVAEVEALLRGDGERHDTATPLLRGDSERPDTATTRHRQVVDRILFLRGTRFKTTEDGSRRTHPLAEIAASAGMSAQWLDRVLKTGRAPNLVHAAEIAAFFGEGIEFLTDPPARALDRVLRQIHTDLVIRLLGNSGSAGAPGSGCDLDNVACQAARALADVPEDTAQPLVALIESVARLPR
ncbi:hypothetical protein ACF1BN_01935 [Streptomyces sp. NPDC014861]|uniref:hypothetical protein n=1 Tax=Streptomyces sp. NPDC014861 TaxID=3364923 RepID=UPI0036F525D5